jgi:hypothetical protein
MYKLDHILHPALGHVLVAAVFGLLGFLSSFVLTLRDPFYHEGWIESHRAWLLLPIFVAPSAVALARQSKGWWWTLLIAVLCACVFAFLYQNPEYQSPPWPFLAWFLHLMLVPILLGLLFGGGWIIYKWRVP